MKVLYTPWRNQGLSFLALSLHEEGDIVTFRDEGRLEWEVGRKVSREKALDHRQCPLYVFEVSHPYGEVWEGQVYFIPMMEYLRFNIGSYKDTDARVVAVSDYAEGLIKGCGIESERILRVDWVTPFKRMSPTEVDPDRIVLKHISSGTGFKNRHGLETILRGFEEAARKTDNLFLDINIQKKNKSCEELIGNMEDVNIKIQNISRDEVREFYRGGDLTLLPSKFEGFGVTAMEALTYCVPPVVSDIPPLNEFVDDEIGRVVSKGRRYRVNGVDALDVEPSALAEVLVDLARNPEQITEMKRNIDRRRPFAPNEKFERFKNDKGETLFAEKDKKT